MMYLGYVALVIIHVAAVICFIRSYRPIRDGKVGRRLIDLGLMFLLLFVGLTMASYMSVTGAALIAGSTVVQFVMACFAVAGALLLVAAPFYTSLSRSIQASRHRRDARKMAQRERAEAEANNGAQLLDDLSGHGA